MRNWSICVAATVVLAGCSTIREYSADYYTREQTRTADEIYIGCVFDVRLVDVGGTKSGVGAGAIGVIGTIAGAAITETGPNKLIGAVTGGTAGSTLGSFLEEMETRTKGQQLSIRFLLTDDKGNSKAPVVIVVPVDLETFKQSDCVRVLSVSGGSRARINHCRDVSYCVVSKCPSTCEPPKLQ